MPTAIRRFEAAGLIWPLSEELTDTALEVRLFPDLGSKQGHRRQIEADWTSIHRELRRKHVTLSILWDEYIARIQMAIATRGTASCTAFGSASSRSRCVGGDNAAARLRRRHGPFLIDR